MKKIRIEISFSMIAFSFPKCFELSVPLFVPDSSFVSSPKHTVEQTSEPMVVAPKDRMTQKVFSMKKVVVPRLIQVHESEPTFGNEVTFYCPPF